MTIKNFDEFLNESLSSSQKKDLDKAWDNYMKSYPFSGAQKKSDLNGYTKGWSGSMIMFDGLCGELEELGWTSDDLVKAETALDSYWQEKAKEEISKM